MAFGFLQFDFVLQNCHDFGRRNQSSLVHESCQLTKRQPSQGTFVGDFRRSHQFAEIVANGYMETIQVRCEHWAQRSFAGSRCSENEKHFDIIISLVVNLVVVAVFKLGRYGVVARRHFCSGRIG